MEETLEKLKAKPLSSADKAKIWDRIGQGWMEDPTEKNPLDVMKEDFGGDENAYLRRMAQHLHIQISD